MVNTLNSKGEWRYGWSIALAGCVGMTLLSSYGVVLSLLIKPMNDTLGWGRSEITAGFLIVMIEQIILLPICASLIPRFGPWRIIIAGLAIYLSAIALISLGSATLLNWYIGWGILGFGAAAISPLIWTTVIARNFVRHRGLAFSMVLSGSGVSAVLIPIAGAYMLEAFGWRGPFYMLGLAGMVVITPLLLWLMSLRNAFDKETPSADDKSMLEDLSVERWNLKLIQNPGVWMLVVASLLIAACVGTLMTHTQAIMRDGGASITEAALYYSATGPSLIVGRLISGALLDRLPTRLVATLLFLLPALSCVILLNFDGSALLGLIACGILGLGLGGEGDVLAYLTAKHFGARCFPLIYSLVFGSFSLGHGMAAVAAGLVFDVFDSYHAILYGLIVSVLCAIIFLNILERRPVALPA